MAAAALAFAAAVPGATPAAAASCATIRISDPVITEGDSGTSTATFTITKSGAGCTANVQYSTNDGSAVSSSGDYVPTSGQLSFGTAEGSRQVNVVVNGDRFHEDDERFFLDLASIDPDLPTFDPDRRGVATIVNDDPVPALSINDVAVLEGDSGTRDAVFTISLSNPGSEGITVDFTVVSGTAGPQDHFLGGGTVAFNPGETVQTLSVPVVGDTEVDSRETFRVNLANAVNATIADGVGVATIVDEGYRMVAGDGGIFTFGERNFHGSTGNLRLNKPIVGGATDVSDDDGYWIVASDGGVFAFAAEFHGSLAGVALSAPAVEIEPTPSGRGYWIVLADGKVYPFGDARHFGDFAGRALNRPVIGMSVTTTGQGYWLVAEDGGIFNFGDAGFFGSTGAMRLNAPVIDLAPSPDNSGYYLVARDGGVFTFGSADFKGSTGAIRLNAPVIAMLVAPNGAGYWLAATDGGVFTFGDVSFLGSTGAIRLNSPVLDLIN